MSGGAAGVINMMVGFENGDAYASFDYPSWIKHKAPASYDPRTRPWYIDAKKNPNELIYTNVYADATTAELMISFGRAFDGGAA